MRRRWCCAALSLVSLSALGCATGGSPGAARGPSGPAAAEAQAEPAAAADPAVAAALARALDQGWGELHLTVECQRAEGGFEAVEVFGSGVGIWDGKRQFELHRDQVAALLAALRDAEFGALREVYGGRDDPRVPPRDEAAALRVTCRIVLRLDGVARQSAQLDRGRQSEELRELAHRLLDLCRAPAATGVTAADLAAGLGKVAAGELAPESLELLVHRRPEQGGPGAGWLLRLAGRRATSREIEDGGGFGDPVRLDLAQDELAALARLLVDQGVADLPINLYADHYTDLVVKVLDREARIQARRFAGMTPATHGAKQERFDRIWHELAQLHRRVSAEGGPGE